jgi:V/A-type H+-transporting ATPase subunit I
VENYHKLEQYIHQNPYTLFYECNNDREYVWGVYFVPHTLRVELEAVYASFHFEEIQMPDDLEDTPRQAFGRAREQLAGYEQEQERLPALRQDLGILPQNILLVHLLLQLLYFRLQPEVPTLPLRSFPYLFSPKQYCLL